MSDIYTTILFEKNAKDGDKALVVKIKKGGKSKILLWYVKKEETITAKDLKNFLTDKIIPAIDEVDKQDDKTRKTS